MKKIGFITSWEECGHAYVTKNFRDALKDDFETFVFATKNCREPNKAIEPGSIWDVSNLTIKEYPYLQIGQHLSDIDVWIKDNSIDIVFFNEMYDWNLIDFCKERAIIVTYLDYFTEQWIPHFEKFAATIICAKHTFEIFKGFKNAHYIEWGVDTNLFTFSHALDKCTFFHSAGWGGINYRKCTPQVIDAFYDLHTIIPDNLFLHTQRDAFPKTTISKIQELEDKKRLTMHVGSVSWPGLYNKGIIHVAPSRLEGLGLYLPEGLSCGMPTITTDAPPMNQFIIDGFNGLLVKTTGKHQRQDYGGSYYFPEYDIDTNDLKEKMSELAANGHAINRMSMNARQQILENNSFVDFKINVVNILKEI
jgi:glycosyltransferase involved in cell wall biosynthesis